jgi:hypothetical protein
MLNKRPIILNCFGGGGSSMLVNMLISHPRVCISSGETHKVFKPGTPFDQRIRMKKLLLYDLPIRFAARQDIFDHRLMQERKPVPMYLQRYIDRILFEGRFTAMIDSHNLYQYEGVEYTREELRKCRLLTKGLDGIIFMVDTFREMYPDAVFFGLVRNGLAACEGRTRRGRSAEAFGHVYHAVAGKMLSLEKEMPNFHLFKYEDMVAKPLEFLDRLYELAGLEKNEVPKIRLLSRPITDKDGQRVILKGGDRQVVWYTYDELRGYIRTDINENQIKQLSPADRSAFLSVAGPMMERLGYPTV